MVKKSRRGAGRGDYRETRVDHLFFKSVAAFFFETHLTGDASAYDDCWTSRAARATHYREWSYWLKRQLAAASRRATAEVHAMHSSLYCDRFK
jgi:hypothetical protein